MHGVHGALDLLPYATVRSVPNGHLHAALHRLDRGFRGVASIARSCGRVVGVMAVCADTQTVVVAIVARRTLGLGGRLWRELVPHLRGTISVSEPNCLREAAGFWEKMGFVVADRIGGRLEMRAHVNAGVVLDSMVRPNRRAMSSS